MKTNKNKKNRGIKNSPITSNPFRLKQIKYICRKTINKNSKM